ncbi:MAG TPA: asparagine synthase (glutamine-hydrolyzing) [Verrucomicrobia bacterium]|nr:asparagine synthase (glutamine-hydrolyzing) [Verrucomicrobiota bacterium]
MCGIVGIIGETPFHNLLEGLVGRIRHRGPDALGFWRGPQVSLGHARLSIIDVGATGNQPMEDAESGNLIVFNGEIYNYIELRNELRSRYTFRTNSDTEVILAAYRQWGVDCLARFRGMFAFALWDTQRRDLFVARDRLGIKPLYLRRCGAGCLIASEIKALVRLPGFADDVNMDAVARFVAWRHQDVDAQTMFHGVEQLLPAHWVRIDSAGRYAAPVRYWSPPEIGAAPFGEAEAEGLRDKLAETVRLHLRSDVPVGAFVSGGLDSSSLACLAAREMPAGALNTFSSMLSQPNTENVLIPVVQKAVQGKTHEWTSDGQGFIDALPEIVFHHDEPIADGSMYAHYELCRMSRAAGVAVLLSGNGGDEVLGGYGTHLLGQLGSLLRQRKWSRLFAATTEYASHLDGGGASFRRRLEFLVRAAQHAAPRRVRQWHKSRQAVRLLGILDAPRDLAIGGFWREAGQDPYEEVYRNCLLHWTVPPFLHYEDRNSMAFGVEIRVPFLDHEVVEHLARFSPDALLAGRTKQALRTAMRGVVPDNVLDQKGKFGFAAPLPLFIETNRNTLRDLTHALVPDTPFLRPSAMMACEAYLMHQQGTIEQFWRPFCLALWHAIFFRGQFVQMREIGVDKPA